jgi:peptidoglycan hydrolase CwlO-like protein
MSQSTSSVTSSAAQSDTRAASTPPRNSFDPGRLSPDIECQFVTHKDKFGLFDEKQAAALLKLRQRNKANKDALLDDLVSNQAALMDGLISIQFQLRELAEKQLALAQNVNKLSSNIDRLAKSVDEMTELVYRLITGRRHRD